MPLEQDDLPAVYAPFVSPSCPVCHENTRVSLDNITSVEGVITAWRCAECQLIWARLGAARDASPSA